MKTCVLGAGLFFAALPATAQHAIDQQPTHALTNIVILEWGPEPPGSGYIHFMRRITVTDLPGKRLDLWVTWLGTGQALPPVGQGCDLEYRLGALATTVEPRPFFSMNHKILDKFVCQPI
ncbi:hypothetical protein [Asticcacaulis sp. AC402]|uniref:hypothetical protein n=1 Tax=Asticcacaulis sp. AC402 TaxID=1282361 RepID=UPI0003C3D301|nr:hypothetical protein [Asticcacaulis sp. AC402]ESQ75273.1 hypothetical protein ABAC402_09215 [Asticcacaulis sp. AC402]